MDNDAITVRVGTELDIHAMMTLAMSATEENGLEAPNTIKLLQEIWAALSRDHGIIGIIGEPGKPIEGAILLKVDSLWYTDEQTLIERAIFVHPDFRAAKGGRARHLIEFAKKAADELGMKLAIGIMSNQQTEAKGRLYRRQLGEPTGFYWIYGGKTGEWKEAVT